VLGTYGSEIFLLQTKDAKIQKGTKFASCTSLMRGHYTPNQKWTNEVWGLETFPHDKDRFASCSDDGTLRIWSVKQRK